MLSYCVIYYEKFKNVIQWTEKVVFNSIVKTIDRKLALLMGRYKGLFTS